MDTHIENQSEHASGKGGKKKSSHKKEAIHNVLSKARENYTSPTGSKHKIGSQKHKYWQDIEKRGKEDKKYGSGE